MDLRKDYELMKSIGVLINSIPNFQDFNDRLDDKEYINDISKMINNAYDKITDLFVKYDNIQVQNDEIGDLSFALRVFNHDIGTVVSVTIAQADNYYIGGSHATADDIIKHFTLSKAVLSVVPFMALNGDESYNSNIPAEILKSNFFFDERSIELYNKSIQINTPGISVIDLYVALQFAKNTNFFKSPVSINFSNPISCSDKGSGILDKDGSSLSSEKYPTLFGEFATQGSGFGLQAVKKIADLRGHYIEVESSTKDFSVKYSTETNRFIQLLPKKNTGSTFKYCFK